MKPLVCIDNCLTKGPPDFNNYVIGSECQDYRYSVTHKQWFLCEGISSSVNKYFYIKNLGEIRCETTNNCYIENEGQKIGKAVIPTRECISSCETIDSSIINDFTELGDFCYYSENGNIFKTNNIYNYFSFPNLPGKVECTECSYITKIDGMNFLRCINCENCPLGYYDKEEKRCTSNCGDKAIYYDKTKRVNQCRNDCTNIKFEYHETKDDKEIINCVDFCPPEAKYYYKQDYKPSICLSKCEKSHFHIGDECRIECNGKYWLEDSKDFFTCDLNAEQCPSTYPYQYFDACFKICKDTNLDIFFKKKTYSLQEKKECVEDCGPGYKIYNDNMCVKNCKDTRDKYTLDNKCIPTCQSPKDKYTNDNLECWEKCPNGYYLLGNVCYKDKCPENSDKQYVNKNNECVACNSDEGFYIFNDAQVPKRCYESCPDGYKFHFHGTNVCYKSENDKKCKDIEPKTNPYYINDNIYECYTSCEEIDSKYKFENDYLCTEIFNCNSDDYYYEYNSKTKCLNKDSYKIECYNIDYLFLDGKECKQDCEGYKILPDINVYDGIKSLGECISDLNKYKNKYRFYSNTEKILREECPYYRINDIDKDTITDSSDGTCVTKCPEEYSFLDNTTDYYDNDKEVKFCVATCQNFYFESADKEKKCIKDCTYIDKYHFNNEKECISECKKDEKYYYYDDTDKTCYLTCKDNKNNRKFSLEASNSPQKCLDKCPNEKKYYYEEDNICLSSCGGGYLKNEEEYICVHHCETGEKIKDGYRGKTCTKECPGEQPFYISEGEDNKCVPNCENYNYYHYKTYQCLNKCPIDAKYQEGKKCMDKCPEEYYVDEFSLTCYRDKCDGFEYYIKKKSEDGKIYYECTNNCKYYITINNECVENCPFGENYIGMNRHCKSYCDPENDGEYYYKFTDIKTENGKEYPIYLCNKIIPANYYRLYDTKLIVKNDCPENYYKSENEKICYKICKYSEKYPFSTRKKINDDKYELICSSKCEEADFVNYDDDDKKCVKGCSQFQIKKIINDKNNECVSTCDDPVYKYETKGDNDEERHCSTKCNANEPKFYSINYNCTNVCIAPYNYVLNNVCHKDCGNYKFYEINEEEEKICKKKCGDVKPYYKEDLYSECIRDCGEYYIIQGTFECTSNCSNIKGEIKYHFYDPTPEDTKKTCVIECPNTKPYLRENNNCEEKCNDDSFNFYLSGNKTCVKSCPPNMKKKKDSIHNNIYECVDSCFSFDLFDLDSECVSSCNDNNDNNKKYYIPSEKKCLEKCNESLYYTEEYKCLTSCEGNMYAFNKECINECNQTKPYYVDEYTHGENDTQKKCSDKCEDSYPFKKKVRKNGNDYDLIQCLGSCEYYDNEKYCYDSCDNYYVMDKQGRYECLESCPEDSPYYFKTPNNNISCHEKCPDDTYKEINSYECVKKCKTKIVNYETKECTYGCSNNQFWSKEDDDNVTYCLDNCNNKFGPYLFYGKKCVKSCDSDNKIIDMSDPLYKKCSCKYLYYENNDGETICLDEDTKCGDGEISEFKYRIYERSQCSKYCLGLLNPYEDICYETYQNCSLIENTDLLITTEKLKCECLYKSYTDKYKKQKICLEKDEDCDIPPYLFYNTVTKECVEDCGNLFNYDNNCLEKCPNGVSSNNNCKEPEYNWYKNGESNYIFLTEGQPCPRDYPYLIVETKECVDKCKKGGIFNDKCYSSCDAIEDYSLTQKKPQKGSKYYEEALYECQCANIWYEKDGQVECQEDSKKCKDFNFKYMVKETKECVHFCPDAYPFYFNGECFKECKNVYQYTVKKKDNSNECICENLWKEEDGQTICLKDVHCENDKFLVNDTKQCVDSCPLEYPLLFNKQCYKNCPENTKINIANANECICEKNWFEQENGNKFCLDGDCDPLTHPVKIYSTNECLKDRNCPENLYNFNNICYDKCPDFTKAKEEGKECVCDSSFGFWYKGTDGKVKCQTNCPDEMKYYLNETKQCLYNCIENGYFEYKNICYQDQCPEPTISENMKTNKYKCITKKYANSTGLDELNKYVMEEIVELYPNVPEGGITYNNFNLTMHVYGIKKDDKKPQNLKIKSSLSYIDLGSCTDKVYTNNKLENSDDIVVVKYDLTNQTSNSLIDPVEYTFVNSRTGQILDMSVCSKNDIVISYSLSNILNYHKRNEKRRLQANENNEDVENIMYEIQKQYYKGKEIYAQYNLDSFDINSTLYTDMCYTFEIDGKDLVLEDRVKFLYPFYSLCEENCTYSKVDFNLERIYCNCPLKKQLNFYREHQYIENAYNKENIKSKQKGPTNLPVMTCMSKLSEKKSISQNGAFFYSLIILILELILLLITIFYSYQVLKNNINKKMNNANEEEKNVNIETIDIDQKEIPYKTSERALNSPPKKRDINSDEIDPNDIKLEKKIIKDEIKSKESEGAETDDPRLHVEDSINNSLSKEYQFGILDEILKEHQLLRLKFESALKKDKSDIFIMLLTEICDKIYLINVIFLLGKFDMFTIYLSAYLLYHLLLLTFSTALYDIETIKNIWNKPDYPGLNIHLGYGISACLIVWLIYKIFLCILDNEIIINKFLKKNINRSTNSQNDNLKENNKPFNALLSKIKKGMIAFFIIEFILGIVCLLYLTTFCAIYTGTKKNVFKTYGIALVEVLIIKIIYGIILGILRKVGLTKQKRIVYNICFYLDKYVH